MRRARVPPDKRSRLGVDRLGRGMSARVASLHRLGDATVQQPAADATPRATPTESACRDRRRNNPQEQARNRGRRTARKREAALAQEQWRAGSGYGGAARVPGVDFAGIIGDEQIAPPSASCLSRDFDRADSASWPRTLTGRSSSLRDASHKPDAHTPRMLSVEKFDVLSVKRFISLATLCLIVTITASTFPAFTNHTAISRGKPPAP